MDKAFLAVEGYSSLMEIQNFSSDSSSYFIFNPQSLDIEANSSSSANIKPASFGISMKGFLIQS